MVHQHIVFGAIIPLDEAFPYELREVIVNEKNVSSFYNGNRLDDEGYFIGVKLNTLEFGSNFDLTRFLEKFPESEDKHTEYFHLKVKDFLSSKDWVDEGLDIDGDIQSFLKEALSKPRLMIIPETE